MSEIKVWLADNYPYVRRYECGCRFVVLEKGKEEKTTGHFYLKEKEMWNLCPVCRYTWDLDLMDKG